MVDEAHAGEGGKVGAWKGDPGIRSSIVAAIKRVLEGECTGEE